MNPPVDFGFSVCRSMEMSMAFLIAAIIGICKSRTGFKELRPIASSNFADAGLIIDFGDKKVALGSAAGTVRTANDLTRADFKIGANTYSEDVLSCGVGDMSSTGLNRDMASG